MNNRHNHSMKGYPYTTDKCARKRSYCDAAVWQCECELKLCSDCLMNLVANVGLAEVVVKRKANFLI